MSDNTTYDVIVIGGGFAGVTATRDLCAAGHRVLLVEARDRLGGRTWYRDFVGTDQKIELGGTWTVDSAHTHVAAEKERYGLATTQSPAPEFWRLRLGGEVRDSWVPVGPNDAADFERAMYQLIAASMRIEVGKPYDVQDLDDLDLAFSTWLDQFGFSRATLDYINAFVGLYFGSSAEEISALHLLSWVSGMGNSPWTLSTTLTDKFADGTKALIDAMIADSDADILLETPVRSVSQDADGVTVTTRAGTQHRAAVVVVATPLNTWKDVEFHPALSAGKASAAAEGHVGHAVKPWVIAKNVPRYFASWAWDDGMVWLSTEFERPEGAVMVGFAHSPDVVDMNDPADVERRALQFLPPGAEVVAVDGHDWNGDEFARGTWMAFAPGQLTRLHSQLLEPEGRLIFAGSDVALRWAGWIDGAIESGGAAAAHASKILGGNPPS